ncbi:hypothetical protein PGT21_000872, partial [Puccinia graminis f. sp. tritici]
MSVCMQTDIRHINASLQLMSVCMQTDIRHIPTSLHLMSVCMQTNIRHINASLHLMSVCMQTGHQPHIHTSADSICPPRLPMCCRIVITLETSQTQQSPSAFNGAGTPPSQHAQRDQSSPHRPVSLVSGAFEFLGSCPELLPSNPLRA